VGLRFILRSLEGGKTRERNIDGRHREDARIAPARQSPQLPGPPAVGALQAKSRPLGFFYIRAESGCYAGWEF
jgi:hypothetical protein